MKRLQKNWHIILFNFIILMIFAPLFLHVLNADNIASSNFIGSPKFRDMGRWSIRLLVISLSISPLVYIFNWRKLVPLRKWAGLWAFAFAGLHLLLFFQDYAWGKAWGTDFARVGLAAFIILAILAATSHRWAMRLLGKNWKRLHRLVYVAGILVVLHSINGFLTWKGQYTASHPLTELQLYGVLIGVLLALRIVPLRQFVKKMLGIPKQKRKRKMEEIHQPA